MTAPAGDATPGRPADQNTMVFLASMTKAVTTVAVMQLVERGRLALDDEARSMVPYLGDVRVLTGFAEDGTPAWRHPVRAITVRHLLTHTAGFAYDFHDETTRRYLASKPPAPAGSQAHFEQPLVFDPGDRWSYGVGIDWAGRVVEAVTGEPLDRYLQTHVLGPLGMTDTTFRPTADQVDRQALAYERAPGGLRPAPVDPPPEDIEMLAGGGGLYGTVRDYLQFTRAILEGGALDGVRVLEAETVEQMRADQLTSTGSDGMRRFPEAVGATLSAFLNEESGWALSFQLHTHGRPRRRAPGSLSWMGMCNTFYWIDPASRLVGVYATQTQPLLDRETVKAFSTFERAVYDALG